MLAHISLDRIKKVNNLILSHLRAIDFNFNHFKLIQLIHQI